MLGHFIPSGIASRGHRSEGFGQSPSTRAPAPLETPAISALPWADEPLMVGGNDIQSRVTNENGLAVWRAMCMQTGICIGSLYPVGPQRRRGRGPSRASVSRHGPKVP